MSQRSTPTTRRAPAKPKGPESRVETITPAKAEEYLNHNTHNRSLRNRRIDDLVAAIKRGEWKMNGDAIKFDVDGTLLDGQHRLWAVVISEQAIESLVITGLDPEAQMTMDVGARRSLKDTLMLAGYTGATTLAAGLNYLWKMENGKVRDASTRPTIQQAMQLLKENPTFPNMATVATRFNNKFRGSTAMIMALAYTFSSIDSEDAEMFFDKLITGVSLEESDPIFALRRWLENASSTGAQSRTSTVVMHAVIVKAWNYWRDGEHVSRLMWKASGVKAEALPEAH